MRKSGIGIGSASVLLVFVVLCLAVFAAITFSTARTDKAMTDAWSESVSAYYEADLLAERILCDILESGAAPGAVGDIVIDTEKDEETGDLLVTYYCPVSEGKRLCVRAAISENTYKILEWRTLDTSEWNAGGEIILWPGS